MSGGPGRTAAPERPSRGTRGPGRQRPGTEGAASRNQAQPDRVIRSQVEPRIVERRRQVRDAQRTRRRRGWIALGVVVALIAAAVGVLVSPLTDVDDVVVTGTDRLTADQLVAASGLEHGDQLVKLDLAAVREQLRAMPWISSATVTRKWPDKVQIVVLEEQPALVVDTGSLGVVVSLTGRVLAVEGESSHGVEALNTALLPRLEVAGVGTDALQVGGDVPDVIRGATTVFSRMSDSVRSELPVARLDGDGALSFDLGDATVVFGPVEDVPEKLASLQSVLDQVVRECMAGIDVREPARPTVDRVEGCNAPPPLDAGDPTDSDGTGGTGGAAGTAGAGTTEQDSVTAGQGQGGA